MIVVKSVLNFYLFLGTVFREYKIKFWKITQFFDHLSHLLIISEDNSSFKKKVIVRINGGILLNFFSMIAFWTKKKCLINSIPLFLEKMVYKTQKKKKIHSNLFFNDVYYKRKIRYFSFFRWITFYFSYFRKWWSKLNKNIHISKEIFGRRFDLIWDK